MTNKGKFHDFPLFVSEKQEPMKKTTLLLGLMALLMSCNAQNPKEMNTERLTYFSFDHHNTMARFNGENTKSVPKKTAESISSSTRDIPMKRTSTLMTPPFSTICWTS